MFDFGGKTAFFFFIVFILITDKTANLTTDTADREQLFPTKLHPYAF